MWIRSQSGELLIKIVCDNKNFIFVNENIVCYGFGNTNSVILGKYSNKEKGLKVLDKIQRAINLGLGMVFNMPKDEDVDINGKD